MTYTEGHVRPWQSRHYPRGGPIGVPSMGRRWSVNSLARAAGAADLRATGWPKIKQIARWRNWVKEVGDDPAAEGLKSLHPTWRRQEAQGTCSRIYATTWVEVLTCQGGRV